ncbi:MAG TPA: hypothetical protein V6D04_04065, partial [Candidatus Obscuribacterales bacterium]
ATSTSDELTFAAPLTEDVDFADLLAEPTEPSGLDNADEASSFDLANAEATELWSEAAPEEAGLEPLGIENAAELAEAADAIADFSIDADFADLTSILEEPSPDLDELDFDLMAGDAADRSAMASDENLDDIGDFLSGSLETRDAASDLSELDDLALNDLTLDQPVASEDFGFGLADDVSDAANETELSPSLDFGDMLEDPASDSDPDAIQDAIALDLGSFDDLSFDSPSTEASATAEDISFDSAETSDELDFGAELDLDLDADGEGSQPDLEATAFSEFSEVNDFANLETAEETPDFAFSLDNAAASFDEAELGFDSLLEETDLDLSDSTSVEPALEAEGELNFEDDLALSSLGTEDELDFGDALAAESTLGSENELDFGDDFAAEPALEAESDLDFGDDLALSSLGEEDELDFGDALTAEPALGTEDDLDFGADFAAESTPEAESELDFGDDLALEGLFDPESAADDRSDAAFSANFEPAEADTSDELGDFLSAEAGLDFGDVGFDLFDVASDEPVANDISNTGTQFELGSAETETADADLFALEAVDDFSGGLDLEQDQNSFAHELDTDLDDLLASTGTEDHLDDFDVAVEPADSLDGFDDLEALLNEDDLSGPASGAAVEETDDFAGLEALLDDEPLSFASGPRVAPASDGSANLADIASGLDSEFDDLEKLLDDADKTLGGPPTVKTSRGAAPQANRRPGRRGSAGFAEQTMRVPVKHLDNLSNLVGELVVNRNSLEQDQERLRQFLDNLLYQVQQLSDVGQRMRDLYERSLLESSLLASRQSHHFPVHSSNSTEQNNHSTGASFDALEMDRFTGFHTLSQEMIELIVRVRESASDIEFIVDETDQVTRMFRQVTTQLQEGLTRSRMVPFAQIADRLPRAVRDIALKCGKQAELHVEGRETLIDKMILEQLYDPMT